MIFEHELTRIKIADLVFDKTNPNIMNQEQMSGLRKAMERFGYLSPIVIDQRNQIADGEHRVLVYKEFGLTEIPAYRVTFSDDSERRLLRQTMNKLRGQHDFAMDADEMALLYEANKLPDLSGLIAQNEATLKELMLKYKPNLPFGHEDDEQLDHLIDEQLKKIAPDTQLGDIYQLGPHRLICADCTDKRSIDNLFEEKRCDMLLTDPPYGVNYNSKNEFFRYSGKGENSIKEDIENDIRVDDYRAFFSEFLRQIPFADYNTLYIFMLGSMLHYLRLALDDNQIKWGDYLLWIKNQTVLGRKDYNAQHEFILYGWKNHHRFYGGHGSTVLEYDKSHLNDLHPVMKPIPLLAKLIHDGSQPNMLVYDPFLGSGSTLIACEQTGRICYGCEIDPHYVDVCCKRWEAYTGQKASKVDH